MNNLRDYFAVLINTRLWRAGTVYHLLQDRLYPRFQRGFTRRSGPLSIAWWLVSPGSSALDFKCLAGSETLKSAKNTPSQRHKIVPFMGAWHSPQKPHLRLRWGSTPALRWPTGETRECGCGGSRWVNNNTITRIVCAPVNPKARLRIRPRCQFLGDFRDLRRFVTDELRGHACCSVLSENPAWAFTCRQISPNNLIWR